MDGYADTPDDMSFTHIPRAQDASEKLRQRARAGLEAAGVCLLGGGAVAVTFLSGRRDFQNADLTGLALAGLLLVVLATVVYGWHMRALGHARTATRQREQLAAVVESTGVGIWESIVGKDQIFLSDSWAQMLGIQRDHRVAMSVHDWNSLVHPDDRTKTNKVVADCFTSDKDVFQIDYRLRHADGRWIWVLSRGTVIARGSDGTPTRVVGTQSDITDRKNAEGVLAESESKFRSLFERSPVGIALTEFSSRRFLQVNDALVAPTGYTREELLGMNYDQLAVIPGTGLSVPNGQRERDFRRKDGDTYPVLISGLCMTDSSGREVVWSIVQDISHSKAVELELAAAARLDRLTGLANRTLFMERLKAAVDRVNAGTQAIFAVLFLDFDRFKVVNDAMGHQAGDELLVQIAGRLRKALRCSDTDPESASFNQVARFGGDEFLILINDLECSQDAARISERLLSVLEQPYVIQGRDVHSTASIGIVTSEHCMADAEAIVRNADVAMYEAKRAGRACSVYFNESMHARLSRNLMIETSLRKALGTDQLSLVYQPIVELDTGKRSSVEALIRWKHPTMGSITPGEFVPVAEESGLICVMGEWVMREACAALARWRKLDPDKAPSIVSVNVSRAELAQGPRLLANVRAALAASGLLPQSLQLEVTEREVMRNPAESLALMKQLQQIGVRLAMDDFGTGTSSLGCLRDYPFDVIKIDQSFVCNLSAGPDTLAVIHATITLVENLGKCSVAEGVETAEQLAILQSLGCHYAQGYFLGRPMAECDVVETERTIIAPRLQQIA
jgi:diguanylate cyclase (GGDEF)-like protein/PAS domain S-box-containing protein